MTESVESDYAAVVRIAILDDYQDQVRHLDCFALLAGHEVQVLTARAPDEATLAAALHDVEALALITTP